MTDSASPKPPRDSRRLGWRMYLFAVVVTLVLPLGGYGLARLWSLGRVAAERRFERPLLRTEGLGWTRLAALAPDSRRALFGSWTGAVLEWSSRTGRLEAWPELPHEQRLNVLVFSPDGRSVLTGCYGLALWDAASRQPRWRFGLDNRAALAAAFFPDGRQFAAGLLDGTLRLYATSDGAEQARVAVAGQGRLLALAALPDGRRVLAGFGNGVVGVWDLAAGREERLWSPHTAQVNAVAVAPGGRRGLSGSQDGTVRLFDLAGGPGAGEPRALALRLDQVQAVAWLPDGRRALVGGVRGAGGSYRGALLLWDTEADRLVRAFRLPSASASRRVTVRVAALGLSRDGRCALCLEENEGVPAAGGADLAGTRYAASLWRLPQGLDYWLLGTEAATPAPAAGAPVP